MTDSRQHQIHEKKIMEMVKMMPFYVGEYVDDKIDNRSSSTLLNYLYDYKIFFEWLIDKKIAQVSNIKGIPLSVLENLKLEDAKNFFKYLQRRDIKRTNKPETLKPSSDEETVEALQTKVERLEMEIAYLKKLNALVQMQEKLQTKPKRK